MCGITTERYCAGVSFDIMVTALFMMASRLWAHFPEQRLVIEPSRLPQSRSLGFLVWCGSFRSLALRAHSRATRSKARLVSKSRWPVVFIVLLHLFSVTVSKLNSKDTYEWCSSLAV